MRGVSMVVRADMLNGHGIAHGGMIFALADTAFAYVCNGANHASVAAQASIVFLDKVREGETLIAEATRWRARGAAGVTRVAVRAATAATIAEFTGYSRTLGGAVSAERCDRLFSPAPGRQARDPSRSLKRRSAMRPTGSMRRDREAPAQ